MNQIDLLTIVMLALIKPLRESSDPADFDVLGPMVARMKGEPIQVLQELLRSEFGVLWDGQEKFGNVVIAERKRLAAIAVAKREIDQKILALTHARDSLKYQAIAGKAAVAKAVETVNGIGAGNAGVHVSGDHSVAAAADASGQKEAVPVQGVV